MRDPHISGKDEDCTLCDVAPLVCPHLCIFPVFDRVPFPSPLFDIMFACLFMRAQVYSSPSLSPRLCTHKKNHGPHKGEELTEAFSYV